MDNFQAANTLREFVREHSSGGCRWFSSDVPCECPLCCVDHLYGTATRNEGQTQALIEAAFAVAGEHETGPVSDIAITELRKALEAMEKE